MILGYYFIKYALDFRDARKASKLFKQIEAKIKAGAKGVEALKELERIGIVLDMPKGKDEAVKAALEAEGSKNIEIEQTYLYSSYNV